MEGWAGIAVPGSGWTDGPEKQTSVIPVAATVWVEWHQDLNPQYLVGTGDS